MNNLNLLKPKMVQNIIDKFCFTIGMIPSSYKLSLTYEEQIISIGKYLEETVYPAINNNAEVLVQLQDLFIDLKNYVEKYFDDLNIQEQINNKLDEMSQSGELQEIIEKHFGGELTIAFPNYGTNSLEVHGQDTHGDCVILKSNNKVFVVDTMMTSENFNSIKTLMTNLNINKIDYFLITHYHGDHYLNLENFVKTYDCSQCLFLLPRIPNNQHVIQTAQNGYNYIINILNNNNLNYKICENETISFDGVDCKIFNASLDDYNFIDATETTDYNNYSICMEVFYKNKKIFLSSDVGVKPMNRLATNYMVGNYDLMKDAHHGFQNFTNNFAKLCNPKNLVVTATKGMWALNHSNGYGLLGYLQTITNNIYISGYEENPIIFTINSNGLELITNNKAYQHLDTLGGNDQVFYVDSTFNGLKRDGTSDFPFKSLRECISLMNKQKMNMDFIYILNTDESDTREIKISNLNYCKIFCDNKVLPHITVENCKHLIFDKLNINANNNIGLTIKHSNYIYITDLDVKNATNSINTLNCFNLFLNGALKLDNITTNPMKFLYSYICIDVDNCTFNNLQDVDFINTQYSSIFANRTNFQPIIDALNTTKPLISPYNQRNSIVTSSSDSSINLLWQGSQNSGEIVFDKSASGYSYMDIYYKNETGVYNSTRVPVPSSNIPLNLSITYPDENLSTMFIQGARAILYPSKLNIDRNIEMKHSATNTTFGTGNIISVTKIVGIP